MEYIVPILLLWFVASQFEIFRLTKANRVKAVMIMEMQIEDCLSDILRETTVDRALLCKIHNGGGEVTIGVTKKISVAIEPEGSLKPHIKPTYTNFPIDRQYKELIIEMIDARGTFVYNNIDQLKFGMLRRRAEAHNITATMHYFIKATKTSVYFVYLGTVRDPNELLGTPVYHNIIEEKVQAIREICNTAARKRLLK